MAETMCMKQEHLELKLPMLVRKYLATTAAAVPRISYLTFGSRIRPARQALHDGLLPLLQLRSHKISQTTLAVLANTLCSVLRKLELGASRILGQSPRDGGFG